MSAAASGVRVRAWAGDSFPSNAESSRCPERPSRSIRSVAVADAPDEAKCLDPRDQLGRAPRVGKTGSQGQRTSKGPFQPLRACVAKIMIMTLEEVERETGFEPATFCLGSRQSAS